MRMVAVQSLRAHVANLAPKLRRRFSAHAGNSRTFATCGMPSRGNLNRDNQFGNRVTAKVVAVTCRHPCRHALTQAIDTTYAKR